MLKGAESILISIDKKMEMLVAQTATNTNLIITGINSVLGKGLVSELKKQTSILQTISQKLQSGLGNKTTKSDAKNINTVLKGATDFLNALSPEKTKLTENFFQTLSKGTESLKGLKPEDAKKTNQSLGETAKGIAILGVSLAGVALISPLILLGTVTMKGIFSLLEKGIPDPKRTEQSTKSMWMLGGAIGIIALAVVAFSKFVTPIGALMVIGTITALFGVMMLFANFSKPIKTGKDSLIGIGIALATTALAIVSFELIGVTPATVGITLLALGGIALVFVLLGNFSKQIETGGKALLWASLSVVTIGLSLWAFGQLVQSGVILPAIIAVGGIALAFGLVGIFEKQITNGAIALIVASVSVAVLSLSLMLFKTVNFGLEDAGILALTIGGFAVAMGIVGNFAVPILLGGAALVVGAVGLIVLSLGLMMFKSVSFTTDEAITMGLTIGGFATAMGIAGALSIPILLGGAALVVGGVSLILLSIGLVLFKAIGFEQTDADNLKFTIKSVAKGFAVAGLMSVVIIPGAIAMSTAGVALALLSGGLAIFKTVQFNEIDAKNLSFALSSVTEGFLGGKMPGGIIAGIKFAAAAAARTALMLITVPPMILAGTALILISEGLRKFKEINFTTEDSVNLESSLSAIVGGFAFLGSPQKMKEKGIEDPKSLWEGVKGMLDIGNATVSLAQGVQAWASMQMVKMTVKDNKIIPSEVIKITPTDIETAGKNIASVISGLIAPLTELGSVEKKSKGWFPWSKGDISKGIDMLVGIGTNLGSLVTAVITMASGSYQPMKRNDAGELVPDGAPKKIGETEITSATKNISKIISTLIEGFVTTAPKIKSVDLVIKSLPQVGEGIKLIAESGITPEKADGLDRFTKSVLGIFSAPENDPNFQKFGKWSGHVYWLGKNIKVFDRIDKSSKLLAENFESVKNSINGMDIEKLSKTDSLMTSIVALSRSTKDVAQEISKSIEEAFDKLAETLKEVLGNSPTPQTATVVPTYISPQPTQNNQPLPPAPPTITKADLQSAFVSALSTVTIKTREVDL